MKPTVYFSRTITPEKVLELYQKLGITLPGKVAVKVHSGEKGNQNFLRPDFWKPVIDHVGGTVVEANTAYEGERNTSEKHRKLIAYHGWSKCFPTDLLDEEGPDLELDIPIGKVIRKNYIGILGKCACYCNSLLLTARKLQHTAVCLVIVKSNAVEKLHRLILFILYFVPRNVHRENHVFKSGVLGDQIEALENNSDILGAENVLIYL